MDDPDSATVRLPRLPAYAVENNCVRFTLEDVLIDRWFFLARTFCHVQKRDDIKKSTGFFNIQPGKNQLPVYRHFSLHTWFSGRSVSRFRRGCDAVHFWPWQGFLVFGFEGAIFLHVRHHMVAVLCSAFHAENFSKCSMLITNGKTYDFEVNYLHESVHNEDSRHIFLHLI